MNKIKENKPKIIVYGIDRVGYTLPKEDIETKLCVLHFEPFKTEENFQNYDGVILFQGIFEEIKEHNPPYAKSFVTIHYEHTELQRRKKQYPLLIEKKGFACFLLVNPFVDRDYYGDKLGTDLAKYALLYQSFYRKNIGSQITHLRPVRNEFIDFIKRFGAAWTYFDYYGDGLDIKEICKVSNKATGIILRNREYFIPSLKPAKHEVTEYFKILADSLISSNKKLSEEIPNWAEEFLFEKEKDLIESKNTLQEEINNINHEMLKFREYKKAICYGDELLKESVVKIFKDGFGFKVNDTDELKEDFKIIDEQGNPVVLFEIKGTNKGGVSREHINQADSHRERAELNDGRFPSILIANTNIKNSRSLKDKYQEIANEQITHAVKMNILVMRTIDLLNMLYLKENGKLNQEKFIDILKNETGWLEASQESWKINKNN